MATNIVTLYCVLLCFTVGAQMVALGTSSLVNVQIFLKIVGHFGKYAAKN